MRQAPATNRLLALVARLDALEDGHGSAAQQTAAIAGLNLVEQAAAGHGIDPGNARYAAGSDRIAVAILTEVGDDADRVNPDLRIVVRQFVD